MIVPIGELGRELRVDPKAIRRAVEKGQVTRRPDGLFDLEQVRIEWRDNVMHEKGRNTRTAKVIAMANPPAEATDKTVDADLPLNGERPAQSTDYAKARAVRELYDARIKKIRYEKLAGSLVPATDVQDAAHRELQCLQDACNNIPSRISAQLALETNPERVYQMLQREIDAVFLSYSEGKIA